MTEGENKDFLEGLNETDTFKLHSYTQQKNFTKGLVDLALLTANANQLIEAIQFKDELMKTLFIVLISLSITLQVVQSMALWSDQDSHVEFDNPTFPAHAMFEIQIFKEVFKSIKFSCPVC